VSHDRAVYGPAILARTISIPAKKGRSGVWQYHSRSDHHSKVACWGILFDLLLNCGLLRTHAAQQRVIFGINHEMSDFRNRRKKDLDLVLATPGSGGCKDPSTFSSLVDRYGIILTVEERDLLDRLPVLMEGSVGVVHLALEAKACMTEHVKARPRLFDELNSSHHAVHGAAEFAIAAGYVLVNNATTFVSPIRNRSWKRPKAISSHDQPRVTESVISKILEIPRRTSTGAEGFDALAISVVDCRNDGSPVTMVSTAPAPPLADSVHYESMIARVAQLYESRFPHA
jgi:hypothetical protein